MMYRNSIPLFIYNEVNCVFTAIEKMYLIRDSAFIKPVPVENKYRIIQ